MADQFATPSDLASLLQQDVDTSTATVLIEAATAVVQAAADGQRIVRVVGDVVSLLATSDSWLELPQIPVTAVTSVVLDGTTLVVDANYKLFGNKLWSATGWQNNLAGSTAVGWVGPGWWQWPGQPWTGQPSLAVVTYTHGYAPGAQELQLARSACLSLAKGAYANPSGTTSESIDDYSVAFDRAAAALEASPYLKSALRKQYGRRGGLVRIG